MYHNCTIKEATKKVSDVSSFHCHTLTVQQPLANTQEAQEALEPKIKVIAAKPLTNPALCSYVEDRKIPVEIAKKYCKEVDFEHSDKRYFAIGFENKSGGFELRNALFKGGSSPKDITQITFSNATTIAVFEGFFSFLSYQNLHQKEAPSLTNFLVLNSLSFLEKSREVMEKNEQVYLYLDRDEAGMKNTQSALNWDIKYSDRSHLYKNHKDLNDYLLSRTQKLKPGQRLRGYFKF